MGEITIDTKSNLYKSVTSRIEEYEVKEIEKGVFEVRRGDDVHEVTLLTTDKPRTFVSNCTCGKDLCEHVVAVAYLAKVKGEFELPKHRDFRRLSDLEMYLYFHEDFTRGDVLSRARMVSPLEVRDQVSADGRHKTILARFDDCEVKLVVDRDGHVRGACTCLDYDKRLPCMHMACVYDSHGKPFVYGLPAEEAAEAAEEAEAGATETEAKTEAKTEVKTKAEAKAGISKEVNLYDFLLHDVLEGEADTVMIFGETGSGKTSLAIKLLKDCMKKGIKTLFIDSEGNIRPSERPENYVYLVTLDEIKEFIGSLIREGKKYGTIILDSIGLPALGAYASVKLDRKLGMILEMQGIVYMLKGYARKHNCLVLITNQPKSEFIMNGSDIKEKLEDRRPFGDKVCYFAKEILRTKLISSNEKETVIVVDVWRSRKYGRGTKLLDVRIDGRGVHVFRC